MKVKDESEKASLNSTFKKRRSLASGPIAAWQIEGVKMNTVTDLIFLGLQNHFKW